MQNINKKGTLPQQCFSEVKVERLSKNKIEGKYTFYIARITVPLNGCY